MAIYDKYENLYTVLGLVDTETAPAVLACLYELSTQSLYVYYLYRY